MKKQTGPSKKLNSNIMHDKIKHFKEMNAEVLRMKQEESLKEESKHIEAKGEILKMCLKLDKARNERDFINNHYEDSDPDKQSLLDHCNEKISDHLIDMDSKYKQMISLYA